MSTNQRQPFIATLGEILVEVMRPTVNVPLNEVGVFLGPYPSGAPAIFIDAVAKLGLSAGMVGCVGDDDFGRCGIDRFRADGVDVSKVTVVPDRATGVAFVTYFDTGERQFLYHIAHAAAGQIAVEQLDYGWLEQVDCLHLNGSSMAIHRGVRDACHEAARVVKQRGGMVTFDPNIRPELLSHDEIQSLCGPLLPYCDYVIPSEGEAQWITGRSRLEDAVDDLLGLGVKGIVEKRGESGCVLYTKENRVESKAFQVHCVDPTGAGDSFCAGFVYGLVSGWDWPETLAMANATGALATTKQGPMEGTETLSEVLKFIGQQRPEARYNFI